MTENNTKVDIKLKNLEGKEEDEQVAAKLTVAQMRTLLMEGQGETRYYKIIENIMDERDALKKKVEDEFKTSKIQSFKKNVQHHMEKITAYIDDIEHISVDFVDTETDKYLEKSTEFEKEILEFAIIAEEHKEYVEQFEILKKESETAEEKIQELITNEENLKISLSEMTEKYNEESEKLRAAKDTLTDILAANQRELSTINIKLLEASSKLQDALDEKNRLEVINTQEKLKSDQLEQDKKNLQEEIKHEKERKVETLNHNETLLKEREQISKEHNEAIESLRKDKDKLDNKISELDEKLDTERKKANEYKVKYEAEEKENKKSKLLNEGLKKQIKDKDKDIEEKNKALGEQTNTIKQSQKEVENYKVKEGSWVEQRKILNDRNEELISENTLLNNQLETVKGDYQLLEKECSEQEKLIEQLTDNKVEFENKIKELEEEISKIKNENKEEISKIKNENKEE